MKLCFVTPPALDGCPPAERLYGCAYDLYPMPHILSLLCATLLRDHGFEVAVRDFPAERATLQRFREFLRSDNSDVYVFYSVFLSKETDLKARDLIRRLKKGSRFIFVGPLATVYPEELCYQENDTIAIRGEPELSLLFAVQCLQKNESLTNVPGVVFSDGSGLRRTTVENYVVDLDALPYPDRRLLDHTPYFNPKMRKKPQTVILMSRGCRHNCWFCVPNSLSYVAEFVHKEKHGCKPPVRLRSVAHIQKEVEDIFSLGFKSVTVMDDQFVWGMQRTLQICDIFKRYGLEWSALARADTLTEPVVKAMADSGCVSIDVGVESMNDETLRIIRKDVRVEQIRKAVRLLKQYGVEPKLNVLIGCNPYETKEMVERTIQQVKKLGVRHVMYSIASPCPGTDLYEAAKKNGWLVGADFSPVDVLSQAQVSYPQLTKDDMEKLIRKAYAQQYFSFSSLICELRDVTSLAVLRTKLEAGWALFRRRRGGA